MSEHVRLGGSKAHRFLACFASPRLEQEAGERPPGDPALDGITAHHIGERCLMTGCEPTHPSFLGQTIMGRKVTMGMVESVQVYVDWARNMKAAAPADAKFYYELPVTLAKLNPVEEMRGSADLVALFPSLKLMVVGDYKHGIGYRVEVKGNKQLRYYALAAFLSLPPEQTKGIERVQLTIVQPRIPHPDGEIRSETIDLGELIDYAEDLLQAAREIQKPDAPATPGDHCLFCNAAATCTARAQHNLTVAQDEFALVPATTELSTPELASIVERLDPVIDRAEKWLKDAKERIHRELLAGIEVPGFKLVEKRATRVWNDPAKVVEWATLDAGLSKDDIYHPADLKSPAQIEELVGKKGLPSSLFSKVSSGYNVVPASSSKPAAKLAAGDEFKPQTE